jgi:hypothetical protein
MCFGRNEDGQLGDGSNIDRPAPVAVTGLSSDVLMVSVGAKHACALLTSGQVRCWGNNEHGQLGNASRVNSNVPVTVEWFEYQSIAFASQAIRRLPESPITLSATASSHLPVAYTATPPSVCSVSGSVLTLLSTGDCTVTARQDGDSTFGAAAPVTRTFAVVDPALIRLSNLSMRAYVSSGEATPIVGFVIDGSPAGKKVAIVGAGDSLASAGIAKPLSDPRITVVRSADQSVVAFNDNWFQHPSEVELSLAGLAPLSPFEPGMVLNLPPGAYTAHVSGPLGAIGVTVLGIYEIDRYENPLINISARARVGVGEQALIAGFIVDGSGPQQVAIVATGPSLAAYGVSAPLANPVVTLVRSADQAVLATNDDWQSAANAAQLQAAGFAPSHPNEAAILVTLPPGAYTAIVSGANGAAGIGVVGVYRVN